MTLTKCLVGVTLSLNIALLVVLITTLCHRNCLGNKPDNNSLYVRKLVKSTLNSQEQTDSDHFSESPVTVEKYATLLQKPVLFTGFSKRYIRGKNRPTLELTNDPESHMVLLHGFRVEEDRIYVLNANYFIYSLHVDILYDNLSQSPIRVMLKCLQTSSSAYSKTLGMVSNSCSAGSYCSLSLIGVCELSIGDTIRCVANYEEYLVINIENTHVALYAI